jgi:uncharacterized protein
MPLFELGTGCVVHPTGGFRGPLLVRHSIEANPAFEMGLVEIGYQTESRTGGAFVDIGVHQDGLVHVSQLADHFVKYPSVLVKAGDVVKVRLVEVDLKRKRIAFSMCKDEAPSHRATAASNEVAASNANKKPVGQQTPRQPKSMPEGGAQCSAE